MEIKVVKRILAANEQVAEKNRRRFGEAGVCVINLMGSPGSGKTSLIEATARDGRLRGRFAVIEGDLATTNDARRIAALDVPVVQINTQGACHLSAATVKASLESIDLDAIDLLFIENVGNLVCPAQFDLGEGLRVVVCSTTEGADKPEKYPVIFRDAGAVVLGKTDLQIHTDFDPGEFRRHVRRIQADLPIIELSCRTGEGVAGWLAWLTAEIAKAARPLRAAPGPEGPCPRPPARR